MTSFSRQQLLLAQVQVQKLWIWCGLAVDLQLTMFHCSCHEMLWNGVGMRQHCREANLVQNKRRRMRHAAAPLLQTHRRSQGCQHPCMQSALGWDTAYNCTSFFLSALIETNISW